MIAIKDFEMPKSCVDCPIFYDMMLCPLVDLNVYNNPIKEDIFKERLSVCPLIEINMERGVINERT